MPGPEDITIDHATGVAFVASQRRMSDGKRLGVREMPGGAIYALDLSTTPPAERLLIDGQALNGPFHPRGCTFIAAHGARRFMVINARTKSDQVVEIFDVSGDSFADLRLSHVRTVEDADHLVSPNDLVALDGERFFAANDHGARSGIWRLLEDSVTLPLARVVFWDGARFHTVVEGMVFGNGIAIDRARRRLIVSSTRSRKLLVYGIPDDPTDGLDELDPVPLPGCPDNLEWDEDGWLWIGAHPSLLRLVMHVIGPSRHAPSQILRVRFNDAGGAEVEEVWRDDTGRTISASSVAAVHGSGPVRRLLIGQPFGNFACDCDLRDG